MLLAVDVGNTVTRIGIYDGTLLRAEWSVATDPHKTQDEWGLLYINLLEHQGFAAADITAVVISSSVPPLIRTLEWMSEKYFAQKPLVVGPGVRTGIVIRYDNPHEVGADRIVMAVAAFAKYGGPLILIDFSTAMIFDVISREGEYLGGVIAPGVSLSVEALFQHAAKLPRIELVRPKTVLARNTIHSMQSGVVFGFAGQVDEVVERLVAEMGPTADGIKVVATGELAELFASECPVITQVDLNLSLDGLRIIYERNQVKGER